MSNPETVIQNQILLALGSHPACRIWRNQTGALPAEDGRIIRFGLPGSADILGLLRPSGRLLAIEVKTPTGRQSDQQRKFQTMIEAAGGVYILARSVAEAVAAVEHAAGVAA